MIVDNVSLFSKHLSMAESLHLMFIFASNVCKPWCYFFLRAFAFVMQNVLNEKEPQFLFHLYQ